MKIRKLAKIQQDRIRYAPKWHGTATSRARKDGLYYEAYCCADCFWYWGIDFAQAFNYNHEYTESNYRGALKKYWRSSSRRSYAYDQS